MDITNKTYSVQSLKSIPAGHVFKMCGCASPMVLTTMPQDKNGHLLAVNCFDGSVHWIDRDAEIRHFPDAMLTY